MRKPSAIAIAALGLASGLWAGAFFQYQHFSDSLKEVQQELHAVRVDQDKARDALIRAGLMNSEDNPVVAGASQ